MFFPPFRCTLEPGDSIIDCPPTFTMYVFDADVNGAKVITGVLLQFLLAARFLLLLICLQPFETLKSCILNISSSPSIRFQSRC